MQASFLMKGIILMSLIFMQTQSKYPEILENEKLNLDPIGFQYDIFYNKAFHYGDPEIGARNIGVLILPIDFSENNLKELFNILSKGYSKPLNLYVEVVTSPEQIRPSGWAQRGNEPNPPNFEKYHWAVYSRSKSNEYFRYKSSPPGAEVKTVILRGSDPAIRRR